VRILAELTKPGAAGTRQREASCCHQLPGGLPRFLARFSLQHFSTLEAHLVQTVRGGESFDFV
jgi:hypothetical protein